MSNKANDRMRKKLAEADRWRTEAAQSNTTANNAYRALHTMTAERDAITRSQAHVVEMRDYHMRKGDKLAEDLKAMTTERDGANALCNLETSLLVKRIIERDEAEQRLEFAQSTAQSLRDSLDELNPHCATLETQLENRTETLDELKAEQSKLVEHFRNVERIEGERGNDLGHTPAESAIRVMTERAEQVVVAADERDKLAEDFGAMRVERNACRGFSDDQTAKLKGLWEQHNTLQAERDKLASGIAVFHGDDIVHWYNRADKWRKAARESDKKAEKQAVLIDALTTQRDDLQAELADRNKTYNLLVDRYDKLTVDWDDLKKQLDAMTKERDSLAADRNWKRSSQGLCKTWYGQTAEHWYEKGNTKLVQNREQLDEMTKERDRIRDEYAAAVNLAGDCDPECCWPTRAEEAEVDSVNLRSEIKKAFHKVKCIKRQARNWKKKSLTSQKVQHHFYEAVCKLLPERDHYREKTKVMIKVFLAMVRKTLEDSPPADLDALMGGFLKTLEQEDTKDG